MNKVIDKLKVAILGPYGLDPSESIGGAHTHMFDLSKQLGKYSDLDVHVITISKSISKDRSIADWGITVHYLTSPKLPHLLTGSTIDTYKVIKKIEELHPDIIHAQCTAPLYGFPASLLSRKYRVLLTVHGIIQEESKTWEGIIGYLRGVMYRIMERYVLMRISQIIVVTGYVKEKIEPLCGKHSRIYVIPVGINQDYLNLNAEDSEKKGRLLFIGGIEPRKGLLHLLKAIKLVERTIPGVSLHVGGRVRKQKYFDELRNYVEKNDLGKNVQFLGFLNKEELKREYVECSVFVFPSLEESQGVVLLEAMAAGKPVVASNIGGIPYVVDDGGTGYLVDYGDVNDLAEKIIKLLENKMLRRKMGEEGKKRANLFSSEGNAKNVYKLYNDLMDCSTYIPHIEYGLYGRPIK